MKSCVYLQRALYLTPTEIRTCCQRFFVDGNIKGDVVIMTPEKNQSVALKDIVAYKKRLIEAINNGESDVCTGCDLLKDEEWLDVAEEKLDTISIEDHSLCNMKCSYCSEDYFGGIPPRYNTFGLLANVHEQCSYSDYLHVAWGGGEPTVRKDFGPLFRWVGEKLDPTTQRVFSNALKYSPELQDAIDEGKTYLTTSIDAGQEKTFQKIRGSRGLDKVCRNLARYSRHRPDLITIKYIFTPENYGAEDLAGFQTKVVEFGLSQCDFLLSTDFKDRKPPDDLIRAIIKLYLMLFDSGVKSVTLDEHILKRARDRANLFGNDLQLARSSVQSKNSDSGAMPVIIWGTGTFSDYLVKSSRNLAEKKLEVVAVVDTDERKHGEIRFGQRVSSPHEIHRIEGAVVIASSNFYGKILRTLTSIGIDQERVMPTFLL